MSTSSISAAMTTAAERRLGQVLEQAGEEQQRDDRQHRHDQARQLGAGAAEPLTAVFDRLPLTTMPLPEPGAEVGGAEADQLAVGVDLVVVAGGVGLGRAEALGEADEHDADRRRAPAQVVVEARRRRAGRRRAARESMWPTISTPWSSRSKILTATMPKSDRDERPGYDRRDTPQRQHERQRETPTDQRAPCVSPRLPRKSQSCRKKSPSPFSTPNSFGTWPMMIVSARPMMKPFSTGSEMKLARKPEPEQAGEERDDPRR